MESRGETFTAHEVSLVPIVEFILVARCDLGGVLPPSFRASRQKSIANCVSKLPVFSTNCFGNRFVHTPSSIRTLEGVNASQRLSILSLRLTCLRKD